MELIYKGLVPADISAFFSIRGNGGNSCFARAVGINSSLCNALTDGDRLMNSSGVHSYIRINAFPQPDNNDIGYYSDMYDKFSRGGNFKLKCGDSALSERFSRELKFVCDTVSGTLMNKSAGIVKNLAVMLMFWGDAFGGKLFSDKNAHYFKFVCSGKIGYKEYAFCMLLSRLGADVLMLLPCGDIKLDERLLAMSYSFVLGECGAVVLPEYSSEKNAAPITNMSAPSQSLAERIANRPQKRSRERVAPQEHTAPQNNFNAPPRSAVSRRELSFEELAELSRSVVMIGIHDKTGDIIGSGSGIAVGRDGFILTNFHVIAGGDFFSVKMENDEKVYPVMQVVKYHPDHDLALIRIDKQLSPLPLYDMRAELKRGQKVAAIGSPMGLINSVSDGIISGFRNIRNMDMIQFTAPISGGSSGGAILNMYGEIIGISTAGFDGGQNLNLAVSCKEIAAFLPKF